MKKNSLFVGGLALALTVVGGVAFSVGANEPAPASAAKAAKGALSVTADDPVLGGDAPSEEVTIDVVSANGSGCRPGTADVSVSPDNKAFTVTYSDYLAQVGVGAKASDFRKNCQLGLKVNVPQGFTYTIMQADYRGYGSLAPGARGLQKASYYFQGHNQTAVGSENVLTGSYDDNWQFTDVVGAAQLVHLPCGEKRNININTELRVQAGDSDTSTTTSLMTMDSTDASFETVFHFAWKKCP